MALRGTDRLVADHDLLGVPVRIAISDPTVAARIMILLAGFGGTRRAPRHVLSLTPSSPDPALHDLHDGDRLVQEAMTAPLAISTLLWYLNQLALETPDRVVIHAGCVARGRRGIVLPGPMEVGKSTLATSLVIGGFDFLSDEYAALSLVDGRLHPYDRPIALDPGVFEIFPQARPRVVPELEDAARWHVLPEDLRAGSRSAPVPPGAVVFPRYERDVPCEIEPIGAARALWLLCEQALNLARLGAPAFAALGRLAASVPAYALRFGDLGEARAALTSVSLGGRRVQPARYAGWRKENALGGG
jgi:hypothetical protein